MAILAAALTMYYRCIQMKKLCKCSHSVCIICSKIKVWQKVLLYCFLNFLQNKNFSRAYIGNKIPGARISIVKNLQGWRREGGGCCREGEDGGAAERNFGVTERRETDMKSERDIKEQEMKMYKNNAEGQITGVFQCRQNRSKTPS